MHGLHSKWGQKLLNDTYKGSNTYVCFTHITQHKRKSSKNTKFKAKSNRKHLTQS